MRVLHITPHLGGGVGRVILDWVKAEGSGHVIMCLDTINSAADSFCYEHQIPLLSKDEMPRVVDVLIEQADTVVVHYWDHFTLPALLAQPFPPCRLVFWCHKNYPVSQAEINYPDLFLGVSPVQGYKRHIRSVCDMTRFSESAPQSHNGVIVGYVGTVDYKKLHADFLELCSAIKVPNIRFIIVGENNIGGVSDEKFTFTDHIDDVVPYYSIFDIFGYPLRPDHYGTCEQVLGEAMCAGVIPVVMDNPAERDIIKSVGYGIIAANKKEYVSAIEELAMYPRFRKSISEQIRGRAQAYYSLPRMRQQWARVFKTLGKHPKKERIGLEIPEVQS